MSVLFIIQGKENEIFRLISFNKASLEFTKMCENLSKAYFQAKS